MKDMKKISSLFFMFFQDLHALHVCFFLLGVAARVS